jgi:hypothetical protein
MISCAECKFWDEAEGADEGQCRRYAPRIEITNTGHDPKPMGRQHWPYTRPDDCCGEAEKK